MPIGWRVRRGASRVKRVGNPGAVMDDTEDMDCERCREAVSARLDDEDTGADDAAVDAHLAACAACRVAADRAAHVTRLVRTRPVESAPSVVDRVMPAWRAAVPTACGCGAQCGCGCQDGGACRCSHRAA